MSFNGRKAVQVENEHLRVTVLAEGGHIAEILHKESGINPLWIPPWKSIEPSQYNPEGDTVYGANVESKLLSGIMGHNLCLDIFGGPTPEEELAGIGVHGEASVAQYQTESAGDSLRITANLPLTQIKVIRTVTLAGPDTVRIRETVENLSAIERAIGWTQHVTLGPPFLEKGVTQFSVPATRSRVFESSGFDSGRLVPGADFDWPYAPLQGGGSLDLRVYTDDDRSARFTTHLLDPGKSTPFFAAFSPTHKLLFGYTWKREDFPWIGLWEENRSRQSPPWNGQTITRGMEFGVSPFPETKRQMVARGKLFDTPTFRWLPAHARLIADYSAFVRRSDKLPEEP